MSWPRAEPIETARLRLEPLRAEHADEMSSVLADHELYDYIGGRSPSVEELRTRYERQVVGHSPDGAQGWLNWVVRDRETAAPVGTVQATISRTPGHISAELAWTIAVAHQRQGYATEAAEGMLTWLRLRGVDRFTAHIHPEHEASMTVARRLGLSATDVMNDGETRWVSVD